MVVLLTLRADCSLVTSKPAHLSPYLPVISTTLPYRRGPKVIETPLLLSAVDIMPFVNSFTNIQRLYERVVYIHYPCRSEHGRGSGTESVLGHRIPHRRRICS